MAVRYNQATQNARLDAVLAQIDANASPAFLEICSASYAAVLATITLGKPSFSRGGTAPSTALTMLGVPKSDTSADNTGTAAIARIKDGAATIVVSELSVGTSGTDIILNSVNITSGQQVSITSGTITHPN